MRKITLYKLQPDYIVGSTDNIDALSAKITEDDKMLKLIEQDYIFDNEKYKKEYLSAMLNYKRNLHLYSWLVLKKYYEEAYMEETVFPNYQIEEMKRHGWMFPQQCITYKIQSSGLYPKTTEELYIEFFDLYFDRLFGFCIGEKGSVIDNYYKQAIDCYKNNNYYSCAVSLFPIIESLHQYINRFVKKVIVYNNRIDIYLIAGSDTKEISDDVKDEVSLNNQNNEKLYVGNGCLILECSLAKEIKI